MALVNEHFFKTTGQLSVLGHREKGKYVQNNTSETGHHPTGHRRRNPSAGPGVRRSDA